MKCAYFVLLTVYLLFFFFSFLLFSKAVCYFTKWVEAEAITDKSGDLVGDFLHRMTNRHGCAKVTITDQGSFIGYLFFFVILIEKLHIIWVSEK